MVNGQSWIFLSQRSNLFFQWARYYYIQTFIYYSDFWQNQPSNQYQLINLLTVYQIQQFKMGPKKFNPDDYVTMTIPREQVIQIKQAFDIFDDDGSGMLDPSELKQAFLKLGFSGQNKFVYQILAQLDEDQSGGIDFPQFLRLATAKISEKDTRAQIIKVFNSFDVNRCGKITVTELKKIAKDLGEDMTEQQLNIMFAKADLDDDGFVTADDFYNMMTHRVYWDSVK